MVRLTASAIIFTLEKHPDGGKSQVDVNNPPSCPLRASPLHGQIQGGRRCLLIQICDLLFSVGWIWWILVSSFLLIPVYCCAFPEIGLAFFFFLEQSVQTYSSQSVSSKDDSSCWGGGGIRGVLTPVLSSSLVIVVAEYCQFPATLYFYNSIYNRRVYNSLRMVICNMCFVKHFTDKTDVLR